MLSQCGPAMTISQDSSTPRISQTKDRFRYPGRYYPSLAEHQILFRYMRDYFKYPERAVERSFVCKTASMSLLPYSSYWSVRTVRLWFNNHKGRNSLYPARIRPRQLPMESQISQPNAKDFLTKSLSQIKSPKANQPDVHEHEVHEPEVNLSQIPEQYVLFFKDYKEKNPTHSWKQALQRFRKTFPDAPEFDLEHVQHALNEYRKDLSKKIDSSYFQNWNSFIQNCSPQDISLINSNPNSFFFIIIQYQV